MVRSRRRRIVGSMGSRRSRIAPALGLIILLAIAAARCIPYFHRTNQEVREMNAIKYIRFIHTVQVQYRSQHGRFASSLPELAAADLLPEELGSGVSRGYRFTVNMDPSGYHINADPELYDSGSKSFYSDQTMVIRETDGPEPATQNSREYGVAAK